MELELSMETLVKRFKDYISYNTQSDEDNDKECPSTPGQMVFAKHLAEELKDIGLSDVTLDAHGYIMATLPANDGGTASSRISTRRPMRRAARCIRASSRTMTARTSC